MTKLFYINLICIIHTCILFGVIISDESTELFDVENFPIEYYRGSDGNNSYRKQIFGKRQTGKIKIPGLNEEKSVIVYEVDLTREFLTGRNYDSDLIMSIKNIRGNFDFTTHLQPREYNSRNGNAKNDGKYLTCNLFLCNIGIFYDCPRHTDLCSTPDKIVNFLYIGFVKSAEYDNLILKLVPKSNTNKNIFSIVICSDRGWLPRNSNSEFINSSDPYFFDFNNDRQSFRVRHVYCNGTGVKTFVSCGYIKQMFMPNINVGYQCDEYNNEEANRVYNSAENTTMGYFSYIESNCKNYSVHDSSLYGTHFLPPGNNYDNVNDFKIGRLSKYTYLYAGHRFQYFNPKDILDKVPEFENYMGYVINLEGKCEIPNLKSTLRLKINHTLQRFDSKIHQKVEGRDTYTFFNKEIKNSSIGCHIVLDRIRARKLKHFYDLRYSTSLLMFDETTKKYIEVRDVGKLVSNRTYKCTLIIKGNNSEIEKPDYIKETEFVINVIYEKTNKSTSFYNSTVTKISAISNESTISNGSTSPNNSTVTKISTISDGSTISNGSTGSNNSIGSDSSSKSNNSASSNNSMIWIIFGISLIIAILFIIVLVILKKLQEKRKKSNKDLSISSSASKNAKIRIVAK